MFDIGWQELFLVALVTIIVVGPKELPRVLRAVTLGIRRLRNMASEFQNSLDELARETEIQEIRRDLEKASDFDIERELEDTVDPTGEVTGSIRKLGDALEKDWQKTSEETGLAEGAKISQGAQSPTSDEEKAGTASSAEDEGSAPSKGRADG